MNRGRMLTLRFKGKTFHGRVVSWNEGCCVTLLVKGEIRSFPLSLVEVAS